MAISIRDTNGFLCTCSYYATRLRSEWVELLERTSYTLDMFDKYFGERIESGNPALVEARKVLWDIITYYPKRVPSPENTSYGIVAATMFSPEPGGPHDGDVRYSLRYFDEVFKALVDNSGFLKRTLGCLQDISESEEFQVKHGGYSAVSDVACVMEEVKELISLTRNFRRTMRDVRAEIVSKIED